MRDDRRRQILEAWKVVVEVQKHFNDISMRIRGMFITILLALFASIGFLLDKQITIEFYKWRIQFATILPLFGVVGTLLFYFIDRYWYHRLLLGAVKHAAAIEARYKRELPEIALGEAISAESAYTPQRWYVRFLARCLVSDPRFRSTGKLHSDGKIELFYKSVVLVLVGTTFVLGVAGGVSKVDQLDQVTAPVTQEGDAPGNHTPPSTSGAAPVPAKQAPYTSHDEAQVSLPAQATD